MNPAPPVIRHRMADWPCTSHARRVGRILPTPSMPHASHRCFRCARGDAAVHRSEEHTSELQSHSDLVCRLLLEKKKKKKKKINAINHTTYAQKQQYNK